MIDGMTQPQDGIAESPSVLDPAGRARSSRGISGGMPHYAWAVRGLEQDLQTSASVLDLGCGVGLFGTYLRERFGCRPHGVDLVRHEGFREADYATFTLRNLETLDSTDKRYDVIFAIGLIEYFPNPRAFFRSVPALLSPRGKLVLTAPNPASLGSTFSLLVRGEFSAFREASNPASITPVLPVDVCRMVREAGLAEIATDYSAVGRIPMLGGVSFQRIAPFLHGRLWSDNFRVVAARP